MIRPECLSEADPRVMVYFHCWTRNQIRTRTRITNPMAT